MPFHTKKYEEIRRNSKGMWAAPKEQPPRKLSGKRTDHLHFL